MPEQTVAPSEPMVSGQPIDSSRPGVRWVRKPRNDESALGRFVDRQRRRVAQNVAAG
jgi:hypothetical protein